MLSAATTVITPTTSGAGVALVLLLLYVVVIGFSVAGMWLSFEKAGLAGWGAIVPVYNLYLLTKMAGREWWWMLLLLIPFFNIIVGIMLAVYVAQAFNKSVGFGLGLAFLGFIFYPILGFGESVYHSY